MPRRRPSEVAEFHFLYCKKCGEIVTNRLCGYNCELDDEPLEDRDPATLEYRIYRYTRTEPYDPASS